MSENNDIQITTGQAKIVGTVAERLLDHLSNENATLAAMLSAVRGVHVALRDLDEQSLQKHLEAEARELASNIAIQQKRLQLQGELAEVLHVAPQEITLRRLINVTTGTVREAIERVWRSLSEMAAELERLNRQNAAMIKQSLAIACSVVETLTGVTGVGESYNAIGVRAETHVGPLMQWGA